MWCSRKYEVTENTNTSYFTGLCDLIYPMSNIHCISAHCTLISIHTNSFFTSVQLLFNTCVCELVNVFMVVAVGTLTLSARRLDMSEDSW